MNESKSVRYQRLQRRARLADVLAAVAWLALLAFSRAAAGFVTVADALTRWAPLSVRPLASSAVFLVLLVLGWQTISTPAALYLGTRVDRRFGRTNHNVAAVIGGHWRAAWIGLAVATLFWGVVSLATLVMGPFWWLGAGALSAIGLAAALQLAAALFLRLEETRPVGRRSLMSALREIARRSGVAVSDIAEWQVEEGARATALIAGLGSSRRVLVSSELLRDWSDDEIAVVVAHELGHHVHGDLWRTLLCDAAVLSIGFGVAQLLGAHQGGFSAGDAVVSRLPLIALIVASVWFAATPLRLAQSRGHERRADRFALDLTGEAAAFVVALKRLGARHLAEEEPSALVRWLFYRHPPVAERIERAERFQKEGSAGGQSRGIRQAPTRRTEVRRLRL
jgi:STE24 endopeptidase